MEKRIYDFLAKNHLMSLATYGNGGIWAASCFYRFDPVDLALVFASDETTMHMRHIASNPKVAGTIAPCELKIHNIQGIQFQGEVYRAKPRQRRLYCEAFPIAKAIPSNFWSVELFRVKMTDNTLGFKTKRIWTRTGPDDR